VAFRTEITAASQIVADFLDSPHKKPSALGSTEGKVGAMARGPSREAFIAKLAMPG
jgi:hypothetical protein